MNQTSNKAKQQGTKIVKQLTDAKFNKTISLRNDVEEKDAG